jgi:hypothetical protein
MLGDRQVRERLDRAALAVIEAAGRQARALFERRLPALGVVVTAGAQEVRRAAGLLGQTDRAPEAREHAERAVAVRGRLQPLVEVLGRLKRQPLLARASEHAPLVPGLIAIDRGGALGELVLVQGARHAAGHHVGRVWPLAPESDHDRQDSFGVLDRLACEATLERRLEQLVHGSGERVPDVRRVAEVRREHQERLPRVAHHGLGHQAQVADARPVRRDRRPVGGLERRRRGVQL